MKPWASKRETLLGSIALYARARLSSELSDRARFVDEDSTGKYLDWLIESLTAYRETLTTCADEPGFPGDTEAEDAYILLEALRTAAADKDNETTRQLLRQLQAAFPLDAHPLPIWLLDAVMDLHGIHAEGSS